MERTEGQPQQGRSGRKPPNFVHRGAIEKGAIRLGKRWFGRIVNRTMSSFLLSTSSSNFPPNSHHFMLFCL